MKKLKKGLYQMFGHLVDIMITRKYFKYKI